MLENRLQSDNLMGVKTLPGEKGERVRSYRATRIARDGTIARRQDDCPPATPVQTLGRLGLELELPAPSCRGASTSINKNRKDIWNYHGFRLENIPIPKD